MALSVSPQLVSTFPLTLSAVDGVSTSSLKSVSEHVNQVLSTFVDSDDADYPDISQLLSEGHRALVKETLRFELNEADKDGVEATEVEGVSNIVPVDLVYVAAEMDESLAPDSKIGLCSRSVLKDSASFDEKDDVEKRLFFEAMESETFGGKPLEWKMQPVSLTDWMEQRAIHLLLEEEGASFLAISCVF